MADEPLTQQPFNLAGFNNNTRATRPRLTLTRLIIMVVFLLTLIGGLGYWQVWRLAEQPRTAVLTEVSGQVDVWATADETWQLATPGLVLHAGDKVRTAAAAAARITYFDGSLTRMSAATTLELTELSARRNGRWHSIAFSQQTGQTEQLVLPLPSADSRFEITTAAARIAVQGTTYQVIVDEGGHTQVTVSEGQVVVYDLQNIAHNVATGDSLTLAPDETTQPPVIVPTGAAANQELSPTVTPTASPTSTATPSATPTNVVTTTILTTGTPVSTVVATMTPTAGSGTVPTLTPQPTFPPTLQPTPTNPPPPTAIPRRQR
ncbi:MAG: FecR domain-containing protein [Chloroflexi bacterium]|nr:FecR domain-containing protein [Chloroflexota bacterium]